ncbi:MAG: DNA-directed RNA polymerase II subunit RPB1, partial [Streblomastix strix]
MTQPFSAAPLGVISSIQFAILSPDEILKNSVCKITLTRTTENGKPVVGGLNDPRLGTIDRNIRCATCKGSLLDCPGHFGHIELARPVYHLWYFDVLLKVMRSVCYHCQHLIIKTDDPRLIQVRKLFRPQSKLRVIEQMCVGKKCANCNRKSPKYVKEGTDGLQLRIEWGEDEILERGDERKRIIQTSEVLEILKNIPVDEVDLMGFKRQFTRPDWLLLQVLPVPPPAVRPSVQLDSSTRSEDDLTHKLVDIVKANNFLKDKVDKGAPLSSIQTAQALLQYHIATYFNNKIPGVPIARQRSGKPIKSISERLKGKEGRIRGNLMGKRVDFSGRTVITPDPNLSVDEVGVPRTIALTLTFPEVVTVRNMAELQKCVENGPSKHPGANYIIRKDGSRIDLRHAQGLNDIHLEIGCKVERHMKNGDYVIFNRQPSLHRMSMMGHKVHILPYSSFRLNLSCTTPYNADFDGDEMNIHLPQSQEARAEVRELMMLPRQIMTPQANRPVLGVVQDTLLGAYLFTERGVFVEKDLTFNMLMWLYNWDGVVPRPAIVKPRPIWTGKQLFSLLIPEGVSYEGTNSQFDESTDTGTMTAGDERIVINNGQLLSGQTCKSILGNKENSLVHIIWKDINSEAAKDFLNQIQRLVNYWLVQRGFTVGISDTIADEMITEQVRDIIEKAKREVIELASKAQVKGELDLLPGKTGMETFETLVNKALNAAKDQSGKLAQQSLPATNNIKRMVAAGSKGSLINLSQITACVGQQNVEGKRIPEQFGGRTLPYFSKFDLGPEAHGFVEASYLQGLSPTEFFFHAMGGREGIIDTAVKTSETGYIQRRLVKAMEDVSVCYDGTVRNSAGDVIQFLYGEDGMAGEYMESQKFPTIKMTDQQFEQKYKIDLDEEEEEETEMVRDEEFSSDVLFGVDPDQKQKYPKANQQQKRSRSRSRSPDNRDVKKMDIDDITGGGEMIDDLLQPIPKQSQIKKYSQSQSVMVKDKQTNKGIIVIGDNDNDADIETEGTQTSTITELKNDPEARNLFFKEFEQLQQDRLLLTQEIFPNGTDKWPQPVNVARLISTAKKRFTLSPLRPTSLSPADVIRMVNQMLRRLVVVQGEDNISFEAQENAILLFQMLVRSSLASRMVTENHRLSRQSLSWVLGEIER